jgi:hypothetical protein
MSTYTLCQDPHPSNGFTPNLCGAIQNRALNLVLANQGIVYAQPVQGGKQMLYRGNFSIFVDQASR